MTPAITALYAGLLGLLYIALGGFVVAQRRRARIGLGTGSDPALERRVRVHGNFAEYAPLFLVLLLVAELTGAASVLLHLLGAAFLLARIGHAFGLGRSSGTSTGRFVGTLVTWVAIVVVAVVNIWLALA
jgi:uncharacterized membrane protein YecN with MAPEG domain